MGQVSIFSPFKIWNTLGNLHSDYYSSVTTSTSTTTPLPSTTTLPTITSTLPTITTTLPTTPTTLPTTASTPKTTTLSYCNDIEYKLLDDSTRNSGYETPSESDDFCDNLEDNANESPDWSGPGWYKFEGSAGNMMPEYPVDTHHCGTGATGWLNGYHPVTPGNIATSQVCFNANGVECYQTAPIQIKNCGGFYLYNLVDTPGCYMRYCAE